MAGRASDKASHSENVVTSPYRPLLCTPFWMLSKRVLIVSLEKRKSSTIVFERLEEIILIDLNHNDSGLIEDLQTDLAIIDFPDFIINSITIAGSRVKAEGSGVAVISMEAFLR